MLKITKQTIQEVSDLLGSRIVNGLGLAIDENADNSGYTETVFRIKTETGEITLMKGRSNVYNILIEADGLVISHTDMTDIRDGFAQMSSDMTDNLDNTFPNVSLNAVDFNGGGGNITFQNVLLADDGGEEPWYEAGNFVQDIIVFVKIFEQDAP